MNLNIKSNCFLCHVFLLNLFVSVNYIITVLREIDIPGGSLPQSPKQKVFDKNLNRYFEFRTRIGGIFIVTDSLLDTDEKLKTTLITLIIQLSK